MVLCSHIKGKTIVSFNEALKLLNAIGLDLPHMSERAKGLRQRPGLGVDLFLTIGYTGLTEVGKPRK